ncbi:MAG: hypothetical protein JOZ43_09165 [Acidobacteriales bacterium]|nr:hypothetical protein [Terriglobales bacterium]
MNTIDDLAIALDEAAAPTVPTPDGLYLFACLLQWRNHRDLCALRELYAATTHIDEAVRAASRELLTIP